MKLRTLGVALAAMAALVTLPLQRPAAAAELPQVVRRRGVVFVVNKKNPRLKARQG